MNIQPLFFAVFLSVSSSVILLYWRWSSRQERRRILERVTTPAQDQGLGLYALLSRIIGALGARFRPGKEEERHRVEMRLMHAGYRSPNAFHLYTGWRVFCTISFGILGSTLFLSLYGLSLQGLAMGYAFLVAGHFAPRWYLARKVKRRRREIFRELPDALDILLICIHAGLSFDRALIRVSGELKHIAPALSTEFEIYFYEVESGIPREQALAKLAQRNEEESLTAVVNVLAQSVRFGTDIAEALRVYTESLRIERRQIAEEKGAKLPAKLVFPTVLFIMPALMLIVMGPAAIRLLDSLKGVL